MTLFFTLQIIAVWAVVCYVAHLPKALAVYPPVKPVITFREPDAAVESESLLVSLNKFSDIDVLSALEALKSLKDFSSDSVNPAVHDVFSAPSAAKLESIVDTLTVVEPEVPTIEKPDIPFQISGFSAAKTEVPNIRLDALAVPLQMTSLPTEGENSLLKSQLSQYAMAQLANVPIIANNLLKKTAAKGRLHSQDTAGRYFFSHWGGPNSRFEAKDASGSISGSFSFVNPYGDIQTRTYAADPGTGFRLVHSAAESQDPSPTDSSLQEYILVQKDEKPANQESSLSQSTIFNLPQDTPEVAALKVAHSRAHEAIKVLLKNRRTSNK